MWVYVYYNKRDVDHFVICRFVDNKFFEIIFEVQIPSLDILNSKWSGLYEAEVIPYDLMHLKEVLPQYMQDICDEHNGIKRMSDFPDIRMGYMKYNSNAICVGGDGITLQIAGCHSEDMGEDFIKNFVYGLRGEWKKIISSF